MSQQSLRLILKPLRVHRKSSPYAVVKKRGNPEGTCKIIYDDNDKDVVYEVIDLREVDWKPCSRRAKKFVSLQNNPSVKLPGNMSNLPILQNIL